MLHFCLLLQQNTCMKNKTEAVRVSLLTLKKTVITEWPQNIAMLVFAALYNFSETMNTDGSAF